MLIASYTKSGGSWLTWMLIDLMYQPDFYCDLVDKSILDKLIRKTEVPLTTKPDVHIFRHPLDVVCSAYNYCLLTDKTVPSITEYIDLYLKSYGKLSNLQPVAYGYMYNYGAQAPIQIKYEDLLENTKKELSKVVQSDRISQTVEKYSVENCRNREPGAVYKRTTNPYYTFYNKATKYYYQEHFTPEQIRRGHEVFADIIEQHWPHTLEEKI